ncbi:hypothetical protein HYFRA_00006182 [Hymenoscyphus fraxineus]|uniref:Major facilitator superfamily (MFS) profile domain-containing protein n=1 Tax=Hymenoscyphus fraxineus TaxID=746836 RepID=A0A9N9L749_9HELO|nr:hypothetical protein HYFRA_00006182 [Hymenoscyphus fraxineus]
MADSSSRLVSRTHVDDYSHFGTHSNTRDADASKDASSIGSNLSNEKRSDVDEDLGHETMPDIEDEGGNERSRDVESGLNLEKAESKQSIHDPSLIAWDGPEDPENPKNWTIRHKWAAVFIVSSFTFISPVSSSMVAPAITSIAKELDITNQTEQFMTLSVFVLAYAIAPMFLGPLSETYGRVIVLQLSNLLYLIFNLACGFARTKNQLIVFRFLSGCGGSAPLAIGGGVLGDLFNAEQRGKAMSMYSLAPMLGPAVGPIAGGFITENTSWRWVFYATSIADAFIQVMGLFFLQETYTPVLLERKKNKLIKESGNSDLHTEFDRPDRTFSKTLRIAAIRPFKLLGTQIIVQVLALYMAYLYGLTYLVLSTFPVLWTEHYHEPIGTGSLNYISLGLGFFLGSQGAAYFQDKIYKALKNRNNGVGKPEFRVPLMLPGAILVPIGLFWYGWSAQAHLHWIMPNIGAVIFSAGTIIGFQCIQTYVVDSYTRFAASALAAVAMIRCIAAFGFPLFASYMYSALNYGWGNSLLAFIAIGLGWPAPILLWRFGETLRKKSKFATG